MFRKNVYNTINIIILAITFGYFIFQSFIIDKIETTYYPICYVLILFSVAVVCFFKCVRLYLVVYGFNVTRKNHLFQFIKTSPVCIVIPFKIGELFRMYCYGYELGSLENGFICILFDRFIDTLALVTLITFLNVFSGVSISLILYLLLLFLLCITIVYFVFSPMYHYWNQYFIEKDSSRYRLKFLGILNKINDVYIELRELVYSRGIALYFISLIAWVTETASYYLIFNNFVNDISVQDIFCYLESALGLSYSEYQRQYVAVSFVFYVLLYCIIVFFKHGRRKEIV